MHVTYAFNEGFVKGALGINSIISRSYYAYNSPPIYKICNFNQSNQVSHQNDESCDYDEFSN